MINTITKKLKPARPMTIKEICTIKLDLTSAIIWSILVVYLVISPV